MRIKPTVKIILAFTLLFSFTTTKAQNNQTRKTIQDIGNVIQISLPIATGLTTLLINDKKGSWQFVKAFSTNIAVTYALKFAINKPRPEGRKDGLAFPSGHTSVCFQSASFIQRRYGYL